MNSTKFKNIAATLLLLSSTSFSAADEIPVGRIDALENLIRVGNLAELDWEISYPASVSDEDLDVADTDVIMKIRVITSAIGPASTIDFGVQLNGSGYQQFYNGVGESNSSYALTPGTVVAETFVSAGTTIDILARHSQTNLPGSGWVSSSDPSQSMLVRTFRNGDSTLDLAGAGNQRSLAEILAPYSKDGIITIGKNEVIHCFELLTNRTRARAFDLQDLITLTTFEQVPLSK